MNNDNCLADKERLIIELSSAVDNIETSFASLNFDDYEAEMLYKGLSDARVFVKNLNWLINRKNNA